MRTFDYIHPIDEMERVSADELGENFDKILDKVEKDNVGYVITREGKSDLVLCPISWLFFQLDNSIRHKSHFQ